MSLVIQEVSKTYKDKKALQQINWNIQSEKIYGLLGRNGAGKSTLLNIIANRSFASEGTITLDGAPLVDNEAALNQIYLMSEDNLYPGNLKVKKCFQLTADFYGDFDWALAEEMIAGFGLEQKSSLRKLSTGYRSIAKLIMALCVPADYIFLDEPVLGLDANHRDLFYHYLLTAYAKRPRTFVISTHLIEEVANLLEEVIIIDEGKVLREATTEAIQAAGKVITGPKEVVAQVVSDLKVIGEDELGGMLSVYIEGAAPKDIPQGVSVAPLNLQAYFVQLTKKGVA